MKGTPLWVLGCMSGTSLDGVDAAMILTDGRDILDLGTAEYRPYTDAERAVLTEALGRWQGDDVSAAAQIIEDAHADLIERFPQAELIGFHGQTLAHDPKGRGTHQAGDGGRLARRLNRPVVWDFRSADVELGGQGAPLAPFYHHAMARKASLTGPAVFLNLGGVGNISWVDPEVATPDAAGALIAFDTGPANAPLNDLMLARRGQPFDRDGALAASGRVDTDVVNRFLGLPYFFKMPPKSLDRNDFPDLPGWVAHLSDADAAATLVAVCAASVAAGLELLETPPEAVFLCGGGRRNPTLSERIAEYCGCRTEAVETIGFDGDMVEAQAFGFLAARVVNGLPTTGPGTTGVSAAVGGGLISHPEAA